MIFLGFISCFIWLWFCHRLINSLKFSHVQQIIFRIAASIIAIWISAPSLWQAAWQGYPGDSFFTLGLFGRIGVLIISASLIAIFYVTMDWKSRLFFPAKSNIAPPITLRILTDLSVSLILFGVFYSISPQVYYTFYQVLIPELPAQIVIKPLFDVSNLMAISALCANDSLSHHLAGLAFLGLVPFTLFTPDYGALSKLQSAKISLYVSMVIIGFSAINLTYC